MSDCSICDRMKQETMKLYEDDKVIAFMEERPASQGHIVVATKEHYPILEQVPDFIVSHCFAIVNKISTAVFDALGVQGTNILVNNGVAAGQTKPHFIIHIIPRKQNDGLDFQWQPKQLNEEEMSTIELQLKEQAGGIGQFQQEKKEPVKAETNTDTIMESEEEENYLIKQLNRIP